MKKIKRIIVLFIVSLFCFSCFFGCTNTSWVVETESNSNESEMIESESVSNPNKPDVVLPDVIMPNVKVGDIFEIILLQRSHYDWHYEMTQSIGLEFVSRHHVLPGPDIMGAAYAVFTFKAVSTGKYIIKFMCKNFIDPDELPVETLVYEITVK